VEERRFVKWICTSMAGHLGLTFQAGNISLLSGGVCHMNI